MKIRTEEYQAFMVCSCCGETFKIKEIDLEVLMEHQKDNKECKGYFNIQVKGGIK